MANLDKGRFLRSAQRQISEAACPVRTDFERDRDRLVHSKALRRLQHKTQAFVEHEGDHFRTRLTHSLEVAQIARAISRRLNLDQDLTEGLALAHDVGHSPFGHAGERALQRVLTGAGEFDHNFQSLRMLTKLEQRYPQFDGLNLTYATLEGLAKHNGPLSPARWQQLCAYVGAEPFQSPCAEWPYLPVAPAFPEAEVAAISDDIAYNVHDLDDGLRSGLVAMEDLRDLPLVGDLVRDIARDFPSLEPSRQYCELTRRMITELIADVVETGRRNLENVSDLGTKNDPLVCFSPAMAEAEKCLKNLLFELIYQAPKVAGVMEQAEAVVEAIFASLSKNPAALPEKWYRSWREPQADGQRVIADFVAGMTDRYALAFYEKHIGSPPRLTVF